MNTADIRGIIFDMDGVIANTVQFHYESWQRLAQEEGVPFSRTTYARMTGRTRDVNLQIFTEGLDVDESTKADWITRKNLYFQEKMNSIQPGDELPGIRRLLDEAQAAGLRLGVGSSSRNARPILQRLQLYERFAVVGDGYTVSRSKPAPDIFLWVAGALGLPPRHVLVLEDSPAGVEAALRGGFCVIGVGDDAPADQAHAHLPHLGDVSLTKLLALVGDEAALSVSQ